MYDSGCSRVGKTLALGAKNPRFESLYPDNDLI